MPDVAELSKEVKELRTAISVLTQRLDAQSQSSAQHQVQHTVLSIATRQGPQAAHALEMRETVLTTSQLEDLNASEGVITIAGWLHPRIGTCSPGVIRKTKHLFSNELKKSKLKQAQEDNVDVPLTWNRGGYSIVYTTCDEDLMSAVFDGLKD